MSNKEQMTIHQALSELKVIDSRIYKAIDSTKFVISNKHSNEKIKGMVITEYQNDMKANFAKVIDLIKRRDAIKRAVVLSNAVTKIVIGDKELTVAEAIECKNHGMEFKNYLMLEIQKQYAAAQVDIDRNSGEAIEKKAEQYVLSVIAAQPKESKMTVNSDSMQALRKDYITNNTYDLIDPLRVKDVIASLNDEIDAFMTDVDAKLSISNALTTITVEY